jgi:hypothetical protein
MVVSQGMVYLGFQVFPKQLWLSYVTQVKATSQHTHTYTPIPGQTPPGAPTEILPVLPVQG